MLQAAREMLDADRAAIPVAVRTSFARLFGCLEDLIPRAAREGPLALMEEDVAVTNLVHDLIVTGTPEAHRAVLDIARFLRFAADLQTSRPRDSLVDFIAYVDLYQEVGGDLEIETPVSAGVSAASSPDHHLPGQGPRAPRGRRTPRRRGPVPRHARAGPAPARRAAQADPAGAVRRRGGAAIALRGHDPRPRSLARDDHRAAGLLFHRAASWPRSRRKRFTATRTTRPRRTRHRRMSSSSVAASGPSPRSRPSLGPRMVALRPRTMTARHSKDGQASARLGRPMQGPRRSSGSCPVPAAFERRYGLRRRAVELIGMLEQLDPADEAGRAAIITELVTVATDAAGAAEEERRRGIDRLTMRVIARHAPAGQALLSIAPLPSAFSHSQFRTYGECGLRYAFERIYRIPTAETKGFLEFGTLVHATFEDFVKRRREARAAGEPGPTFEDLRAAFDARWTPETFADAQEAQHFQRRSGHLLERFYARELASLSEAIGIEQGFTLVDPPDGGAPIRIRASSTASTATPTAPSRSSTTRPARRSHRGGSTET